MAPLKEFFEQDLRYKRDLAIHVLDDAYSSEPYKNPAKRRLEALESATKYETNLFAEIAKVELGKWSDLSPKLILESVDHINQREANSVILLIGLLGIVYRYMENPSFPEDLKGPIEDCILKFKYWSDEPGKDALNFTSESHTILECGEAFAWGGVWEWTSTAFAPYPGFVAHPYRDYSQPWFDGRPVLRGASFATAPRLKHPSYRNYFTAERNDLLAGFRSCAA